MKKKDKSQGFKPDPFVIILMTDRDMIKDLRSSLIQKTNVNETLTMIFTRRMNRFLFFQLCHRVFLLIERLSFIDFRCGIE